ncbi:MAG: SRPBCC family protein [Acidobacteriota bacterium]
MGMQIEKSFVVRAAAPAVWSFLIDPYRVASCLPGAAITEKVSDQEYKGTMNVKVGPVTASYRGKLRFERLDEAAGEAELSGSGQETKGKGGADMRMKSRVVARSPEETEVTVVSDVNVFGILAQFGRGMIQDVSDQMFGKFSDAMRRQLETPAADPSEAPVPPSAEGAEESAPAPGAAIAEEIAHVPGAAMAVAEAVVAGVVPAAPFQTPEVLDVGAIGAAAAGRAAVRMLERPGFWITLIALAALVYLWLR